MTLDRRFSHRPSIVQQEQENEMENILNEIGGSFGRFQIFNYILFSIVMFIAGLTGVAYIFTALDLDFR